MKYLSVLILLSTLLILSACSKEDEFDEATYSAESTIYSEQNNTVFRELLLVIKPYILDNGNRNYILTETLKNVEITINTRPWGIYSSMAVDTFNFNATALNNYWIAEDTIKYPVIAHYQPSNDVITTAGGYSDLLNAFWTFQPGFYVCKVHSFDILRTDGTYKTVYPNIVEVIEIKTGTRSSYMGEYEIEIK